MEFQTRSLFSEIWILLLNELKDRPLSQQNLQTRECLRCFQYSIGQSPVEYLMNYRISMAKKLLEETNCSVTDIALRCGFSSNSYFGKIFREKCEETPGQYRARMTGPE